MNGVNKVNKIREKVPISKEVRKNKFSEKKRLVLARWQGFEDDGSSGCYNYNFKS